MFQPCFSFAAVLVTQLGSLQSVFVFLPCTDCLPWLLIDHIDEVDANTIGGCDQLHGFWVCTLVTKGYAVFGRSGVSDAKCDNFRAAVGAV